MRPRCLLHPELPTLCRDCQSRRRQHDSTIATSGQTSAEGLNSLEPPEKPVVQIWAAGTGGGHLRVAQALAQALSERSAGRVSVAIDDPLAEPIGRSARHLAGGYGPLVRTSPALWGLVFRSFSISWLNRWMDGFLLRQVGPAMAARTRRRAPLVVVNCHPLLGAAVRLAADAASTPAGSPAVVTLMTDLVGGHQGWLSPLPDALLTATPEATTWCLRRGVPAGLLVETGLPIDPVLAAGPLHELDRQRRRRDLGLDPYLPVVLLGGGAEGAGAMPRLVRWLGQSTLPLQVVVACGHNRRLARWLRQHPNRIPTLGLTYQPSLTPWIQAADVYLGKAGPSTLAEAAAAGLAIVVTDSLPGQEENNGAALVAAGAAVQTSGPAGLREILGRLFRPGDPLRESLQQGALRWARPTAARRAAEVVLSFADAGLGAPGALLPGRIAAGPGGGHQPPD